MQTSTIGGLAELSSLQPNEEIILSTILNIINTGDDRAVDKEKVIQVLANYPLRLLYALSERSPEINELLESNDVLNLHWSSLLQKLEYPSIIITSFDKTKEISLFAQLKGAFLLSELNKNPDLNHSTSFAILNKACQIGMFNAMIKRLNFTCDLIMQKNKTKKDSDTMDTYVEFILKDVQSLSNLYWAIGCIDASLILFNIVQYYFETSSQKYYIDQFFMPAKSGNFSWISKYDDKNNPYPILILEKAVESLYVARLLANFPQSQLITEQITHGKGLLAGYEDSFKTPDELQNLITKKLNMLQVPLVETFCNTAFQHSIQLINEYYPDVELPQDLSQLSMK